MPVIDRSDLEASPLADLHAIAGQLGLDGFRRLRRAELIEMILKRQGPGDGGAETPQAAPSARAAATRGRGRGGAAESEEREEPEVLKQPEVRKQRKEPEEREQPEVRKQRKQRERREQPEQREEREQETQAEMAPTAARAARGRRKVAAEDREEVAEGVVELQGNGSAFLRLRAGAVSEGDVYVSAAQVRRCELVDGDLVAGPARTPRRSERYPSLIRVETINGVQAEEVAGRGRYEELPAVFPNERFTFASEDETLKAIEWLTPIGRGSRVVIAGGAGAGKSETLRLLLDALGQVTDLEVMLALVGVRPEEISTWSSERLQPEIAIPLGATSDALSQAVERVVDLAKRRVARAGHVLLAIDCVSALNVQAARKALAAARNITDGGSLTVIATAERPFGGETTVIALDALRTMTGRLPALDLVSSFTIKPELLVGEDAAREISAARAEALRA